MTPSHIKLDMLFHQVKVAFLGYLALVGDKKSWQKPNSSGMIK